MYQIHKICANPTVDYAAEELKKYLRMMMPRCGDVPISYDPSAKNGFRLGLMQDFGIAVTETDSPDLDDVLCIETDENGGIIAGSNYRSVLLAVYRYLRANGCRWLFPGVDGEYVPVRQITPTSYRKMADLRVRAQCNEGAEYQFSMMETIEFTPKIGLNSYMLEFDNPKVYYNYYYNHRHNTANRDPEPISNDQVLQWKRACETEIAKRGLIYQDMGHGWTASPFGIDTTEGWAKDPNQKIPEESRDYIAFCEGGRKLFHDCALNTNFCMSNPKARAIVAKAIADYAENSPFVNYLHVWLADSRNNHCECDDCRKMTPSDWYAMLMNEIDEQLTERNLDTRIVFCVYYDTAWAPKTVHIKNPDRFTMLLGAITRRYTETPKMVPNAKEVRPFELNKNVFPSDLGEYIALLREWEKKCAAPKFCYEYHFWIHQYYDVGGIQIARRIYEDVAAYRDAGFDGIIEDGSQRSFFPNGFAFFVYAETMFDKNISFDALLEDYFSHAYGTDYKQVAEYLEKIGKTFDVNYLECEHRSTRSYYAPDHAAELRTVPAITDEMLPLLTENKNQPIRVQTVAWRLLLRHAEYCRLLSEPCALKAEGRDEEAYHAFRAAFDEFGKYEVEIERYYDQHMAVTAFTRNMFKAPEKPMEEIG